MVIRFYFASGSLGIIKFIKRRGAILSQGIKFFQNAFTPGCLLKKVKDLPPDVIVRLVNDEVSRKPFSTYLLQNELAIMVGGFAKVASAK